MTYLDLERKTLRGYQWRSMNPSARPWYPPGEAATSVPTTTVRRQNDPYQLSAVQRPPMPLCGDSDLSSIRLESLNLEAAAAAAGGVIPSPAAAVAPVQCSRKGPYRSKPLLDQTVPVFYETRRNKQHWMVGGGWTSDATPLRLGGSGTPSSLESQGDSQENTATQTEELSSNTAPKMSIPLPRSQRRAESIANASPLAPKTPSSAGTITFTTTTTTTTTNTSTTTSTTASATNTTRTSTTRITNAAAAVASASAVVAAVATPTTSITTPTPTTTATTTCSSSGDITTTSTDSKNNIKNNNNNNNTTETRFGQSKMNDDIVSGNGESNDDIAADDNADIQNGIDEVGCEGNWQSETRHLSVSSSSLASGIAAVPKKQRPKAKREEKWTIVQGKGKIEAASPVPQLKKATQSTVVVKVRENGAVVRLPDLHPVEKTKTKQQQQQQQQQKEFENNVKDETIIETKSRRQREVRRSKGTSEDDELLESLMNGAMTSGSMFGITGGSNSLTSAVASASGSGGEEVTSFSIMGVPLASVAHGEQLLLPSQVPTRQKNALRIFLRSLSMSETSNAKTLLLQRALQGIPESCYHQCPSLVCAILLETSDSCVDVEKSLQTCYRALQLAEKHKLDTFEMLARLAITRTFARVIDTMDARTNLTQAARIAIAKREKAALGWIAMQMGVTLEISGQFPESLAWYEAAERLARATGQQQLLCDVHCCQSIAYSAVGEMTRAQRAYEASRAILPQLPRHRHQRPLQNYAQLKCQLGDMDAALQLQEMELEIAKEAGDTHALSRCMGAIALTKRFLGRYDEAAENHMEEMCVHNAHDPRQSVESLTGAAACWRMGGHLQKAHDYCTRALRQAQQCQDLTTLAKALVELAEAELSMSRLDQAQQHLGEALATVARVDEAEQKQYLVKAALCEVEWRCCSILEQVHFRKGEVFEALQCSDRCHVPNTAHVARLLLRRQRRASASQEVKDTELVSRSAIERLLRRPSMSGWRIVCYSLPWNEGLEFTAYVLSLDKDGNLTCVGHPLRMRDELVAFICGPNAVSRILDAPLCTETGERIYGDTPLWPQLYSKVAFDFQQSSENAERVSSLAEEPLYCLRLLYDSFIKPLESDITDATGMIFVGDGVFSRLPFHAFHDGERYLAERCCTSTCCSMALLCTHFAEHEEEKEKEKETNNKTPPVRRCTVVDDARGSVTLLDPCLAAAAADDDVSVRRVVIDADVAELQKETTAGTEEVELGEGEKEETKSKDNKNEDKEAEELCTDAEVAVTQQLLGSLHRRGKVKGVRNTLYRAVHEAAGGVLELRLRALPEVKEDYCGSFVGASSDVIASHSSEVANTWDLRSYQLVVCTGVGTYGGLSIHETGIPMYRSLQYAGARRMLLATGSRVPSCDRIAVAATMAALKGHNIAAAVRAAYLQCISEQTPLFDWAGFSFVGLPL